MSNEHNPPAFPVSLPGCTYGDGSTQMPYVAQEGMTLRDYFAGQALAGILANNWATYRAFDEEGTAVAAIAYQYADKMLESRNR